MDAFAQLRVSLLLLIKPNGSKLWYVKCRFGGKEKKMPIGQFPEIGLAHARRIRDVARVAADEVVGISVAFLICGSTATPAELRAASSSFPVDVGVVAIVCDPDAVPGFRRVAGLSVLTIGYLDDLRVALARSAAVA